VRRAACWRTEQAATQSQTSPRPDIGIRARPACFPVLGTLGGQPPRARSSGGTGMGSYGCSGSALDGKTAPRDLTGASHHVLVADRGPRWRSFASECQFSDCMRRGSAALRRLTAHTSHRGVVLVNSPTPTLSRRTDLHHRRSCFGGSTPPPATETTRLYLDDGWFGRHDVQRDRPRKPANESGARGRWGSLGLREDPARRGVTRVGILMAGQRHGTWAGIPRMWRSYDGKALSDGHSPCYSTVFP